MTHYEHGEHENKRGLTLQGLVQLYSAQAEAEPTETWLELTALGFDLTLERGAFASFEAALAALHPSLPTAAAAASPNSDAMDLEEPPTGDPEEPDQVGLHLELVRYAEQVASELPGLGSLTQLKATQLPPVGENQRTQYPLLSGLGLRELRLRFGSSQSTPSSLLFIPSQRSSVVSTSVWLRRSR